MRHCNLLTSATTIRAFTLALILPLTLPFADSRADDRPPLPLEPIFSGPDFHTERLRDVQWDPDGSGFTFLRTSASGGAADNGAESARVLIFRHDLETGREEPAVPAAALDFEGAAIAVSGHTWSPDRRFLLLDGPRERTWDSVFQGPHYVVDVATGTVSALDGGNTQLRNVQLSPAGRHVGFVRDNNLFITDLVSGDTRAVTTDGNADIFNGIFDYGSTEFGFRNAWHWSPDGSKIAFWRLDATEVPVWNMIDQLGKYPEVRPMKYPNTGEKHAVNRIGVYDLANGETTWMDTGDNPNDYIPRIDWSRRSDTLAIQRLSRDHDRLDLLLADTTTGASRVIVTDTDPAWIEITRDLTFFSEQDAFVWTSEKSGYRHAYRYDYDGNETRLTSGDWEISSLLTVDEANGWLYFTGKKDGFINQHVYRVSLEGGDVEKLSESDGWTTWAFSPDHNLVIETWSDASTPPRTVLRRPGGDVVRTLIENDLPGLAKYAVPNPEFLTFETDDGITLNAYMIKPPGFDPSKRYPVVSYGYGNAGSQMVVNRWGSARGAQRDLWHRHMAAQGYLVWCMDNRTTAGRGKQAYNLTYGEYGKWAVLDQVQGATYLRSLPFVDPERIGFWGWSGGGYLAAALMTKGAPHFQVGVSVAPVIDLINYQAVGVERWMDQLDVNPEGYAAVNLENFADRLEGDLLLIHGTGDENVKFAFTLQFADSLIKAGKQFDMMVYPNEHHGIEGARQHVYTKIANYFHDKL
ncbi:S9 family peptidase [Elongatibacter sediminis]|uniref:S9 family peptidase n=1 Tax=Elongatibacter sediminis TaxID=3119006 RepID=A0AAW9RBS4_9GAMM